MVRRRCTQGQVRGGRWRAGCAGSTTCEPAAPPGGGPPTGEAGAAPLGAQRVAQQREQLGARGRRRDARQQLGELLGAAQRLALAALSTGSAAPAAAGAFPGGGPEAAGGQLLQAAVAQPRGGLQEGQALADAPHLLPAVPERGRGQRAVLRGAGVRWQGRAGAVCWQHARCRPGPGRTHLAAVSGQARSRRCRSSASKHSLSSSSPSCASSTAAPSPRHSSARPARMPTCARRAAAAGAAGQQPAGCTWTAPGRGPVVC
jgi:hypothetical protein